MAGIFDLVGAVAALPFEISGQQEEMKAAEGEAAASASMATFRAQQSAAQYALYNFMQQRAGQQVVRKAQQGQALSFGTGEAQAGSGYGFSSAAGGAKGQIKGEESTAIGNLSANMDFAQKYQQLNEQISQQQINYANFQTQMAQGAGEMALGKDIGSMISAFGGLAGPNFSVASLGGLFGGPGGNAGVSSGGDVG